MFKNFKDQLYEILSPYAEKAFFDVTYPKEEFGHYATNIAFGLAKIKKEPIMKVAGELVSILHKDKKAKKLFSEISVASPGFINFTLSFPAIHESLRNIIYHVLTFGKVNIGNGRKINIEFVSANPTGPLTMGNGRSAAYGDSLAKILEFSGFKVTREYFINDVGNQTEILGESVARRFMQLNKVETDFPEEMYQGKYITDIARQMKKEGIYHGSLNNFEELKKISKEYAIEKNIGSIEDTLKKFGLSFDVWFSERTLREEIYKTLDNLKSDGFTYESEGAVWFKAKDFGLEKDVVLKKSIGEKFTTYLASDFAYARNKISRNFDLNVYVLGADHHGDVQRLKAGIKAMGFDEEKFKFLLYQLVTLKKSGKSVRMSKRKGKFVALEDLMKEIPADVIRFFFLMKSLDKHIDFDLELAKEESNKNPIFYIEYAYARIKSLLKMAKEKKMKWNKRPSVKTISAMTEKEAITIAVLMSRFPETIEETAKDFQVHRLAGYLYDLASAVHSFYDKYRIIGEADEKLLDVRINLLSAAGEVIRQGLELFGITAPDKM